MSQPQDIYDRLDEMDRIVRDAQTGWDAADKAGTIPDPAIRSQVGSIRDYVRECKAIGHELLDTVPEPAPPPPPPSWHGPAAGFYGAQRYGNGARQWGNLTIPSGTPKGVLVQVHGGGWMQGDPNVASPPASGSRVNHDELYGDLLGQEDRYGLRQMASYAAQRWGVIVWEPAYTYSTGNPDVCLHDVVGAINWLISRLQEWGGGALPLVYAGHSAGGQLSLRAALSPFLPAPKAWLGMAAAGLTVHSRSDVQDAPGGFSQGGTGWIFQTAWNGGDWSAYAPDTHLTDRPDRFPLYLEQGNQDGRSDGSVLVRWARDFVSRAQAAGWPVTYHEQSGADHYSIRWDQSAVTRADMDAIWG